ncbi:MAG: flavodoxin family protein [Bacteroides sp.]|nr:flavodoxin family protein [Bacteroides sp.]
MKITIINGSPRKNGSTAKILKKMRENFEEKEEVTVTYYDLVDYSLLDCSGCLSCYAKGICHLKDNLEDINNNVAEADALLIGSPVYVSNVPATLKKYIDRGHFVLEQSLYGKYTYAVCTYEIGGSRDVISILNKLFRISGGIILGNLQIKLPFNSNPLTLPGIEQKLEKASHHIYNSIKKKKSKKCTDRLFNWFAIRHVIRPYAVKKPKQYKAVLERWVKLRIV